MASLLPNSTTTTPREKAVEGVMAERWAGLDIDVIRRSRDAWECDAHLLPYLAVDRGVDLWYDDWPEEWKRRAIDRMPRLKTLKGKVEGIRGYLALLDIPVTYIVQPPSDGYLGDIVSEEERAAWLAMLPQIRIYPFRDTDAVLDGEGYVDDNMLLADTDEHGTYFDFEPELVGERLYIWHAGIETPLVFLSRVVSYRAGQRIETVQMARPFASDFDDIEDSVIEDTVFEETSAEGIITVSLVGEASAPIVPVPFSERAAMTRFELVSQSVPADPTEAFLDDNLMVDDGDEAGTFFGDDDAGEYVYRRAYLSDPAVRVPDMDGSLCVDQFIWDFPPYTLIVGIDVSERVPEGDVRHIVGETTIEDCYFEDDDSERVKRALEAIRCAQGGSDRVVVDIQVARPLKFGDAPKAGAGLKFGQMIRSTWQ